MRALTAVSMLLLVAGCIHRGAGEDGAPSSPVPQPLSVPPAAPLLPAEPVARADVALLASQLQKGLVRVGRALSLATQDLVHDELREAHSHLRSLLIATRQWLLAIDDPAAGTLPTHNEVDEVRQRANAALDGLKGVQY